MNRLIAGFLALTAIATAAEKFQPLFNGGNLDGWAELNGKAKYEVVKGEIVGTTAEGSPNSFLCTTKSYANFILELEVKTDPALNSGVQIRSHQYESDQTVQTNDGKKVSPRLQKKGRVHGLQVEVANEKAGTSGGIYDEAGRGWVANTSGNAACAKAFKDNQWNQYRIEAKGPSVKTWVNGVACADLNDNVDKQGFIGLQVHQYKGEKPAEVRFRNIRIAELKP